MSAVVRQAQVAIRQMREQDIDLVMEVEHAGYDFPWSPAIFRDCLRVGYHCSVLTYKSEIIGYSILSMAAGEAHLLNLCILKSRTGEGYGSHLLGHVFDTACSAGCNDIYLEVRPSNQRALNLYRRFGFRSIGTRPKYYRSLKGREDAYVLTATLNGTAEDRVFTVLPFEAQQFRH